MVVWSYDLGQRRNDGEPVKTVSGLGPFKYGHEGTLMLFWQCSPLLAPIPHSIQPTVIYIYAFLLDANEFISVHCDKKFFVCLFKEM